MCESCSCPCMDAETRQCQIQPGLCFGRRVGLDDPQRSLPTPTILWFCDSVILWLARMPFPPQRSARTVAITHQRSLETPRESMVWLTPKLSRCRNLLFCLMQPCCFGSVDKLQLEEAPAWWREYNPHLQSYAKSRWELYISMDLEEGLLKDSINSTQPKNDTVTSLGFCLMVQ